MFENEPESEVTYSDLILVRHASNAYQVYLQGESSTLGIFTKVFEVFTGTDDNEVF